MSVTHESVVDINVTFAAVPVPQAGFGTTAVFAEGQTGYGDDTVTTFTSTTAIDEAFDAGDIDSATQSELKQAFRQLQTPERVLLVNVASTADASAYESAFDALVASGIDFYGVAQVVKSDTSTQIALARRVEEALAAETPASCIYALETANTEWSTAIGTADESTAGAGDFGPYNTQGTWADLQAYERTALVWRDALDANKPAGTAWFAYRLTFSPDDTAAQFTGELRNVDAEDITGSEKTALDGNNANLVLPFFNAPARILPGVNLQGRPLAEIRTGDWLRARIQERLATVALDYDRRGETIPVGEEGQGGDNPSDGQIIVSSEAIQPVVSRGVAVGTIQDNVQITYPTITSGDIQNQRIPIDVEVTSVTGAVRFKIGVFVDA